MLAFTKVPYIHFSSGMFTVIGVVMVQTAGIWVGRESWTIFLLAPGVIKIERYSAGWTSKTTYSSLTHLVPGNLLAVTANRVELQLVVLRRPVYP